MGEPIQRHKRPAYGKQERMGLGEDPSLGANGRRLYANPRWKASRKTFLQRFPLCVQCDKAGRITPAQAVDHIKPHRGDERLFWDSSNWQALCYRCHNRKTASETRAVPSIPRVARPKCAVALVCGAPGSGRAAYVRDARSGGDLVIDMETIALELWGGERWQQRTVDEMRLALIERNAMLSRLAGETRRTWIIAEAPRWSDRRLWQEILGCELIVIEREAEACAAACADRPPRDWLGLAKSWWSCYSGGSGEKIVR